jgi:hypothetical protein
MNPASRRLQMVVSATALTVSVLCAAAAFGGLVGSIIKPNVELHLLFHLVDASRKVGIALLVLYFLLGSAIDYLYKSVPDIQAQTKLSTRQLLIFKFSALLCLLLVILSPHLYVYPSGSGWITASKVSTTAVTEAVAREYLWRGIRMWSGIVFWPGLGIAFLARNLLMAVKSRAESSR